MKAKLVYRNKIVANEHITELVIWALPDKSDDRPHGLKYRLFYGDHNGKCLIRYDNESGKCDHKHIGINEIPYTFTTVDQLMKDFLFDIANLPTGGES